MSTRRMQLTFNETLLLSKNKDFFELKNNETKRLNAFLVVKNVKYIFRLYQDNNNRKETLSQKAQKSFDFFHLKNCPKLFNHSVHIFKS